MVEVKQRIALDLLFAAAQHGPDVDAIERLVRQLAAAETSHSGKDVHQRAQRVRHTRLRDSAQPAHDERLANAAFISGVLATAQLAGTSLVPRSVIAREHHERIVVQADLLHRAQHFAHAPVDLFHHVSVEAFLRPAAKLRRRAERYVRKCVRHVEEERRRLRLPNEPLRLLGVALRQRVERSGLLDNVGVAQQHSRSHVVAVGNSEILIKPAAGRQILNWTPEVPLADAHRLVAANLQNVGERGLVQIQALLVLRNQHARYSYARGVPSREQRGAGGRAHRIGRAAVREPHSLR